MDISQNCVISYTEHLHYYKLFGKFLWRFNWIETCSLKTVCRSRAKYMNENARVNVNVDVLTASAFVSSITFNPMLSYTNNAIKLTECSL